MLGDVMGSSRYMAKTTAHRFVGMFVRPRHYQVSHGDRLGALYCALVHAYQQNRVVSRVMIPCGMVGSESHIRQVAVLRSIWEFTSV